MLETLFKRQETVERLRKEPVGEYLDGFVAYMAEVGCAPRTMCQYLGGPIHFGRWAPRAGVDLSRLRPPDVERFRLHLRRCRCRPRYHARVCCTSDIVLVALRWFVTYLRQAGIAPPLPGVELPTVVGDFETWMRRHRGTADRTLADYRRHVLRFVEVTGIRGRVRLDAAVVRGYVIERAKETTPIQMRVIVRALRMFLRFLVATGRCPSHLDRAVPSVAHWRLATLPRYLAGKDVERVIARCDRTTPIGRRDRAILLLLARLGLRAGDVYNLRLADLDWDTGRMRVSGKLRRSAWLPLPQEVGDAILAYLSNGRPVCSLPEVFVCAKAPRRPLRGMTVSGIACRAIVRAGVTSQSRGAHVFRHSTATTLLRGGATLDDIGVLLRHASRESTAIYAKVDMAALSRIAQPWPRPSR